MDSRSTRPLSIEVLENTEDFAALEEQWDQLYHDAPLATPFQSWAWLYSWWEYYGEGYELRLVVMSHGDLLLGVIPLMLERRWGFGRLLFIGTGTTDYLDALVRQGWETEVSEAVGGVLRRMGSWQVADLQELRPGAAVWELFQGWSGPRIQVRQNNCPVIEMNSWDHLLTRLSKNLRSTVRRTLKKVEADGWSPEVAGATDAGRAARRCVTLHREYWQGRGIVPEALTERFEHYFETLVCRMTASGLGGVSEFRRGDEVLASTFWVFGKDFVGFHTFGATQEAIQRYQLSSLYIWDGVSLALDKVGASRLDLLRGEEPYKMRWKPEVVTTYRLILGRNRALWVPYAFNRALRARARHYAESEDAPPWIRKLLDRLRH